MLMVMHSADGVNSLTLAGPIVFLHTPRPRGEGGGATPLAVWPLIELELRGKNERVGRYTRRSD